MSINSFDNYYMSWKPVLKDSDNPIYLELVNQLESDIKSNILLPGTKLPPQRELADYLGINLGTVTRALKTCTKRGLITAVTGKGTYVASDVIYQDNMLTLNPPEDKIIEMGATLPSTSPNHHILDILSTTSTEPNANQLLQYNFNAFHNFQHLMAEKWLFKNGLTTSTAHILFASGGQNAIVSTLVGLFSSGDKIGCDEFTYPGFKSAAKMLGIILVPIKQFDEDSINYACKHDNIKGLYIIPDYHNPTALSMPCTIREDIGKSAIKHNLIIIEDAINHLLGDNILPPVGCFCPEQTIYISSLSKTISPGLRLAFVSCPTKYKNELSFALYNLNISVSALLAQTAANLIQSEKADIILEERREFIRKRNIKINSYFKDYHLQGDLTCPFRWLIFPPGISSHTFEQLAKAAKVQVYAADRFFVGSHQTIEAIRISVISEKSDQRFEKGLNILLNLLFENSTSSNQESFL